MNSTRKALDEPIRHFHCETRLADPTRTGDRDQAYIRTQQEFFRGGHFLFPPHKSRSLRRNIGWACLYRAGLFLREAVAYGSKLACEIPCGDVTLVGLFCQTPLYSPTERGGGVGIQ